MILDAAGCDSVRLLVGETEETLPDTTLQDPLIGGAAEATIMALVGPPAYEDRPAGEQAAIKSAVVYQTAALWLGTQRTTLSYTSERFSQQYQYTRAEANIEAWIDDLTSRAVAAVSALIPPDPSATVGSGLFVTMPGRRGQ
jgi:hypothetical protein